MSLTKFESDIKHMAVTAETAYERCADLRNFESLKKKIDDPAVADTLARNDPDGKMGERMAQVRQYVNGISFEADCIHLHASIGNVSLRIVERDPKCIKFAGEGSPVPLFVWVQFLPEGTAACKMKVTVGAEVNFFIKGMISKPLRQAADGLAAFLQMALSAPLPAANADGDTPAAAPSDNTSTPTD